MPKGIKKKGAKGKKDKVKKNPLFEKRPRNFRVGGDIQHKRDLTRFVKWPKYILIQRQKRILMRRLKVPPAINQFTKTIDKGQANGLFKLLAKYKPETHLEKKKRLLTLAQKKAEEKADPKKGAAPIFLKCGLNHVTTLVENKKARLVAIAHDVDPLELVVWLPQLCRKQGVPFCILGKLVNMKSATCVVMTDIRKEDQAEFDLYCKNFKAMFNDDIEIRKHWGGGQLGIKSRHQIMLRDKLLEKEEKKKAGL